MKVFADASLFIYLNVPMREEQAQLVDSFWKNLLSEHEVFTNLLVLDEVVYVSKRRYDVKQEDTLEFIDRLTSSPALKGEGSLQGFHRFPASIRVYIFHLQGSRGGQRSPHLR